MSVRSLRSCATGASGSDKLENKNQACSMSPTLGSEPSPAASVS